MPKSAGDCVERIVEIAPSRRRVRAVGRELPARPFPAAERRLSAVDFIGAHTLEEIVLRIVLADMVEAKETPLTRAIEIGRLKRCLELTRRVAARGGALRPRPFDPTVHSRLFRSH